MKNNFCIKIFWSTILCLPFCLQAVNSESFGGSSSAVQERESQEQKEKGEEQSQLAAGMVEASRVAKDYVEGLDRGEYAQSWAKGDELFQRIMSERDWTQALDLLRKPLGRMQQRTLKVEAPAWNPQGLPEGMYMVVQYDTSFEKNPEGKEVLTLRRLPNGQWRVLTYIVN